MSFAYVVFGAGRQGVALAYDLAKNCEAGRVTLAELDPKVAAGAAERLRTLLADSACEFVPLACDVSNQAEAAAAMKDTDVVLSAVPYRFNLALTDAALAAGASFCDLGGNTQVVRQQLERHAAAQAAGVSIVPDCGLAPGLGNLLAAHGVQQMDTPRDAHVRCGGLPERPIGPLGYKLSFNFQGLVNEYSGHGEFLRDGQFVEVPALTELEEIEFPPPIGRCEAAVTSGGTSTCAHTFRDRLRSYDYKTVRYPGHFAIVRALFELGCFEEQVNLSNGETIAPKITMRALLEERLRYPEVRDIVVLRCTVNGKHEGHPRTLQYDLSDRHDEATGFSAMERATAFPTTLVAYMQARRVIAPGAQPLEVCVPTEQYVSELPQHDITITVRDGSTA